MQPTNHNPEHHGLASRNHKVHPPPSQSQETNNPLSTAKNKGFGKLKHLRINTSTSTHNPSRSRNHQDMSLIWITLLSMIAGMSMGAVMFNYLTAATSSSHLDASFMVSTTSTSTTGSSGTSLALPQQSSKGEEVVAYAITITNCTDPTYGKQHPGQPPQKGGGGNHHDVLLDMAAVLKHSIHLTSRQNSKSRYDYQMYAFLHEDAKPQCQPLAPVLTKLGYTVLWKPTPFSLDDISDDHAFVKTKIQNQGCCGEREFLKLYTLGLVQHKIAVHLDLDSVLFKPMDHLYDAMLHPDDNDARHQVYEDQQPQEATGENKPNLPLEILSYFTRDYNMAIANIQPSRVLMQGGFWIVRPNQTTLEDIVSLITNHADLYDKDCGWGGCALSSARLYGGAGFQGVISYYYTYYMHNRGHNNKQGKSSTTTTHSDQPASFVELDRCYYNSMADKARKACFKEGSNDVVACNHCNEVGDFSKIYGAHLTLCQKPRLCGPYHGEQLCYRFQHAWHAIRADWERQQQLQERGQEQLLELDDPVPDDNPRNKYAQRIVKKFPNHCHKLGERGYVPMDLPF